MSYIVDVTPIVLFISRVTSLIDFRLLLFESVVAVCLITFFIVAAKSVKGKKVGVSAIGVCFYVSAFILICALALSEWALNAKTFKSAYNAIIYSFLFFIPTLLTYVFSSTAFADKKKKEEPIALPKRKLPEASDEKKTYRVEMAPYKKAEQTVDYDGVCEFIDGVTCEKNAERAAMIKKRIRFYDGLTPDKSIMSELNLLFNEAFHLAGEEK